MIGAQLALLMLLPTDRPQLVRTHLNGADDDDGGASVLSKPPALLPPQPPSSVEQIIRAVKSRQIRRAQTLQIRKRGQGSS